MNCEDFEMLMADAWGDELTASDRLGFEAHLADCERCRREYETGRRALAAMRALPGPQKVHVKRQGSKLILHAPASRGRPLRRRPRWLAAGVFRYAASVLIAIAAGYAFHAGLMVAELGKHEEPVVQHMGQREGARTGTGSFERAILAAHERKPSRSSLAKCMIAMFPPKG